MSQYPAGRHVIARRAHSRLRGVAATTALVVVSACGDSESAVAPSSLTAPSAASLGVSPSADVIPGQYIVTFRKDVSDVAGMAKQLVAQNGGQMGFTYTAAIKGFSAKLPDQAVAALQRNPQIARIEADQVTHVSGTQTGATWGLDRIDQRSLPLSSTFDYANSGAGVNVYIIDSGIRTTHADFGGRAIGAFTAVNDGKGSSDCNGHGTHVAGTVGGTLYGVAKSAKLYSVRVSDCTGTGAISGLLSALDWVTKNRVLPAVANMSVQAALSSTLNSAVLALINSGVVGVVAAGNDASDACRYSPGSTGQAITVGASASFDAMSGFSNTGSCVDLFAPGQAIVSAWYASDTGSMVLSGTSMAAPHVAGVAALYLAANPSASPSTVASAIVASATTNVLTSIPSGTANRLLYMGEISSTAPPPDTTTPPPPATDTTTPAPAPAPPPPPPPTTTDSPPTASFTASCPHGKCAFDGSGSTDDRGIVTYVWSFGDGSTASSGTSLMKVSHTYTMAGTYTISLVVKDGAGQQSAKALVLVFKKL